MVDGIELTKGFLNIAAAPMGALSLANGIDERATAQSTHTFARTVLALPLASASYLATKGRVHTACLSTHIPSLRGHAQIVATLTSAVLAVSFLLVPALVGAIQNMSAGRGYFKFAHCCSMLIKMLITVNKIITCALTLFGLLMASSIAHPSLIAYYLLLSLLNLACAAQHSFLSQETRLGLL